MEDCMSHLERRQFIYRSIRLEPAGNDFKTGAAMTCPTFLKVKLPFFNTRSFGNHIEPIPFSEVKYKNKKFFFSFLSQLGCRGLSVGLRDCTKYRRDRY